jgi:proteasome lid subunit RPN8/RPN11
MTPVITLRPSHLAEIFAHAREAGQSECCGLISGTADEKALTVYKMQNVARDALVSYEVAPEELFAAQREMRQRDEQLLAIYHSHPRSIDPTPSETDVRLAYYPAAVYFIVGLANPEPTLRAFRISEAERRWERVEYAIADA